MWVGGCVDVFVSVCVCGCVFVGEGVFLCMFISVWGYGCVGEYMWVYVGSGWGVLCGWVGGCV